MLSCRLCSAQLPDGALIALFDDSDQRTAAVDIIFEHLDLEINASDPCSKHVCSVCWSIVGDFHELYERVQLSERTRTAELPKNSPDWGSQPAAVEAATGVKLEESDLVSVVSIAYADDDEMKVEVELHEAGMNVGMDSEITPFEPDYEPSDSEEASDCTRDSLDSFENMMRRRGITSTSGANYYCDHCDDYAFGTKAALLDHFRAKHHPEEAVSGGKLDAAGNKGRPIKRKAKRRRAGAAEAAGAKERFPCEVCGKFFANKYVLATHIRAVHENAFAHMCHVCAKTFKSKHIFELHQLEHSDQHVPKLQCNICGNWLKHEHSLRKHMARHFQSEQTCQLCGKVVPNAHALGNHIRYVHSERLHKCHLCDKAFKKPIGLKEHLASHSGVNLYTCPYCPQAFKSSSNMYAHRKKRHMEQWSLDREQRIK